MKETEVLIDQILEDHKDIKQDLAEAVNDSTALAELDNIKGDFVPGRFDQKQSLERLQATLEKVAAGLEEHFTREEKGLLVAFERSGDEEIAAGLRAIFQEHEEIRARLAHSKEHVAQLIGGGLSSHLWAASAHDMRTHLSQTRRMIEAHAGVEQDFFQKLKK